MLNYKELLQTAQERTGLSDFGNDDFMEGFQVLIQAISSEANIRESSLPQLREYILRMLMNRAWFAKDLKEHPDILQQNIESPAIIASLPRTGSTKLQRILGASGGIQTPSFWMTYMFARIPDLPEGGVEKRIQLTRDYEKWMYETSPEMLIGHPMFTDEAEEDLWLLECSFRHMIHTGVFHVPTYNQWLANADITPAFEYLADQIKYLRWQFPQHNSKPWVSKTPTHFGFEAALSQVYKKPRFIVTHRDPVKCIPSITLASMAQRKVFSDYDNVSMLGSEMLQMFADQSKHHLQWRDANPDAEILDLGFTEVTQDGIGAARKVFEFLDIPFTKKSEQGVRAWETKNPKDKHGKAKYSASSIGCTDDQIREAFSDYRQRFADHI